MRNPAILD